MKEHAILPSLWVSGLYEDPFLKYSALHFVASPKRLILCLSVYMSDILYKLCSWTCDKLLNNKLCLWLISLISTTESWPVALIRTPPRPDSTSTKVSSAPSGDLCPTWHPSSPGTPRVRLRPSHMVSAKIFSLDRTCKGVTVIMCTSRGWKTHHTMIMPQDGRTARANGAGGGWKMWGSPFRLRCDVT